MWEENFSFDIARILLYNLQYYIKGVFTLAWEYAFLDWIQANLASPWLDAVMKFITYLSDGGAIWVAAAIVMLVIPKYRRYGVVLSVVIVSGAVLNSLVLKPVIGRVRPFVGLEDIMLLITPPGDASFPSGHTLVSVSSAIVILRANKKLGIAALVLASLIAFSRMYLYVHFPTDIIAGVVLAIIISMVCIVVSDKIKSEKCDEKELP